MKAVKQLVDAGTDVNAKDEKGSTPLHKAGWGGHTEIAERLTTKGANMNVKDKLGYTTLNRASRLRKTKTVNLLRKKYGSKMGAK